MDAASRGAVNRCRPCLAVGLWCGGEGGCAVVIGAASGVTQQVVGGQDLPEVVVVVGF